MYPINYTNKMSHGFGTTEPSFGNYWYKWQLPTNIDQKQYLIVSKTTKAGLNEFQLAWDRSRMMLTIQFVKCCLTNEQLNKDVKAAIIGTDDVRLFEKRRDYFLQSDESTSKKLIFIFKLKDRDFEIIRHDATFYSLACFVPDCDVSVPNTVKKEKTEPLPSTALDLTNLLENGKFSDVKIVTFDENGERHEFSAHWLILTSRSDVFEKMFENDLKEKSEGKIEILEFNTDVIQQVLAYIYSGNIDVIALIPIFNEVLRAADYYNLDPLRQIIGQMLIENLTRDNAFEYLVLSEDCKVPRLKKAAVKFIVTNIDNIPKHPGFQALSNSHMHLMKDLLVALTEK